MSQTLRGQNRQNIKTRVDYRFGINGKVSGYSEKKMKIISHANL